MRVEVRRQLLAIGRIEGANSQGQRRCVIDSADRAATNRAESPARPLGGTPSGRLSTRSRPTHLLPVELDPHLRERPRVPLALATGAGVWITCRAGRGIANVATQAATLVTFRIFHERQSSTSFLPHTLRHQTCSRIRQDWKCEWSMPNEAETLHLAASGSLVTNSPNTYQPFSA